MTTRELSGRRVYLCPADGPSLAEDRNLSDLVGELFSARAGVVAIPLERLGPDFLRLASGVAGQVLQKLVNYRFQVAVLGDVSAAEAASAPLRDFIRESNRGATVWFAPDLEALEVKLGGYGRA
jgi:hypothetical protein